MSEFRNLAKMSLLLVILLFVGSFTSSAFANHDRYADRPVQSFRPLSFYFGGGFGLSLIHI